MARRFLVGVLVLAAIAGVAQARGIMVPKQTDVPPLAMVDHRVNVAIEDQVAVTTFEQTFRNSTDRQLEATYVFPVPKGANVNKFTMWVDGKETAGELLDAKKARDTYTEIVRRSNDPGLLEYIGNDMMKLRVFPILPKSDQRIKVSFTSVSPREGNVVEYLYPLKTDGSANQTLESFSVKLTIKSQHPIQSVYSPTHAIDTKRNGDKEVAVEFEKNQALLDKDFQLFYGLGDQEIGLTLLLYRPVAAEDGYFMLLVSPQLEAMKASRLPRDVVLVLDTSGSMSDLKMSQAKKALKHLLGQLGERDRFGIVRFSNAAQAYEEKLLPASADQIAKAQKWVGDLTAGNGTNIEDALETAVAMKSKATADAGRAFTIVFFTDGQPTVGERNPDKIVKETLAKNAGDTRIFTFGVGDDVNAAMLDQLAEGTKAVSTYVRPAEDIETKAMALGGKISHPVLTNVKLTAEGVKLNEVYPPKLPDLFHGSQLVVIGRYAGQGPATVKLTGTVGTEEKVLSYKVDFPQKSSDDKAFVEQLWARRKVGFMLDQIRINGESTELVDSVTSLAKKYGIATPYTSYLVVPDGPMPVIQKPGFGNMPPAAFAPGKPMPGFFKRPEAGAAAPQTVAEVAKEVARQAEADKAPGGAGQGGKGDGLARVRGDVQNREIEEQLKQLSPEDRKAAYAQALQQTKDEAKNLADARQNYARRDLEKNQKGKLGVDLAVASNNLRCQSRLSMTANRLAYGRTIVDVGGIWVDDQFQSETPTIMIKAMSEVYFRILERQPLMKDVYRNGNHLVWVTPSGTALVIDPIHGKERMTDAEIDALFVVAKK